MTLSLLTVREFTPNDRSGWTAVGDIAAIRRDGNTFTLTPANPALADCPIRLSLLSPTCLRVRFAPRTDAGGAHGSGAVITETLAPVDATVVEDSDLALVIDTGALRIAVDRRPYRLQIYRDGQLIHTDEAGHNIVFVPGGRAVANLKRAATNARYCGLAETPGASLAKNFCTMTQFNFDNFACQRGLVPPDNEAGPLNPSETLYASIPLLLEVNPRPVGEQTGAPYCCGVFFDNPAQSFFNISANDYSDMSGLYYFGAVAGELNYYLIVADRADQVLDQYTTLTGRAPMPPKYVFGFHQGCYGYYDRRRLEEVAARFRAAGIPCDGLHIDVDFQNNYRAFTHSERKFPQARQMLDALRTEGFKCSTIVTPMLTDNPMDETGRFAGYPQRAALAAIAGLLYDVRAGRAADEGSEVRLFTGGLGYGTNFRVNPYHYPPFAAYPPLAPNRHDATPLGASGNYPDFGRPDVRQVWGAQYAHLVQDLGMDMIWQDMTCPALEASIAGPSLTLPLDLMLYDGAAYAPHGLLHNAYAQWLIQATWEGLARLRPDQRNFILSRGGFAGMQRYAALWTGDNASSWDFLRISIPQVLNIGLSGVPISGADIGGFARGDGSVGEPRYPDEPGGGVEGGTTDPELLVRWMQLGAFLPWYRNHYNGYDKAFQEPWAFDEATIARCRRIVRLRYRLVQLLYDAMYEWTQTGLPIARALFLTDPGDLEVYNHLDDQFCLGRDLMIAPIVEAAAPRQPARRQVYLPGGQEWYPFTDADAALPPPIPGGTLQTDVVADLDTIPVYVRAGAILPLASQAEDWIGQRRENPLIVTCYPGPDRDYVLYQDDGTTTAAAAQGAYRLTRISQETDDGARILRFDRRHDGYTPAEDHRFVDLRGCVRPTSVTIDGHVLTDAGDRSTLDAVGTDGFAWDPATATTRIKLFDRDPLRTIRVDGS
jgi:Alpha-glucosidases, family 31 of glycosyl hydrolases